MHKHIGVGCRYSVPCLLQTIVWSQRQVKIAGTIGNREHFGEHERARSVFQRLAILHVTRLLEPYVLIEIGEDMIVELPVFVAQRHRKHIHQSAAPHTVHILIGCVASTGILIIIGARHYRVLRQREVHRHRPARRRHAIGVHRIGRIGVRAARHIGLVGTVIAVFRVGEVRRIGESDGRGQRMTDGLNLTVALLLREVVHAVDGRRGRNAHLIIIQAVESIVGRQRIDLVQHGIPLEIDLLEIPFSV